MRPHPAERTDLDRPRQIALYKRDYTPAGGILRGDHNSEGLP
jgi:hypothetical protein